MRDGSLGAVLIYKFEQETIPSLPPLPEKKRLKIATMNLKEGQYIVDFDIEYQDYSI